MRKILIATPAYGGQVNASYMMSILRLINIAPQEDIDIKVLTLAGESLVTRARNNCVAQFMESDCDSLFFIDADIEFTTEQALRVINAPYPVAAACYPLKKLNWNAMLTNPENLKAASIMGVVNSVDGEIADSDGWMQVLDAGSGFLRIDRKVLEEMTEAYPELKYETDQVDEFGERIALFDTMLENGRYLSEDYAFCRRWQKLGGKIVCDWTSPILRHHGTYVYGQ